jgi:uncharacterized protein
MTRATPVADTPKRRYCAALLAALHKGDFDATASMTDPDFVLHEAEGLPYAGDYGGKDAWRELSASVVSAWSGFRMELLEYLGETPDALVIRVAIFGKSRRTGRPFATTVLELWRFRGETLIELTPHYWDTHALALADTP